MAYLILYSFLLPLSPSIPLVSPQLDKEVKVAARQTITMQVRTLPPAPRFTIELYSRVVLLFFLFSVFISLSTLWRCAVQ